MKNKLYIIIILMLVMPIVTNAGNIWGVITKIDNQYWNQKLVIYVSANGITHTFNIAQSDFPGDKYKMVYAQLLEAAANTRKIGFSFDNSTLAIGQSWISTCYSESCPDYYGL